MNPKQEPGPAPYARTMLKLMKGPVYTDHFLEWTELELHRADIRAYFAQIGIELVVNDLEGYAYLTQDVDELNDLKLPRLIRRRELQYEITLLCVILRQKLIEFDNQAIETPNLFISRDEIVTEIELFLPDRSNRTKLLNKLDSYINTVKGLGYLEELPGSGKGIGKSVKYEVKRILHARVSNQQLEEIRRKLKGEQDD